MSLRTTARAYPALLRAGFASAVAYRTEFLIWMFSTNMPLVMLALWSAVARSGPVAGFTQRGFTAYYLSTLLVRLLTGCWVVWELTMEIRQGMLSMRLLRPIHPLIAFSADHIAAIPMRGLVALPVVSLLLYFARAELAHDPFLWALVPVSLAGAFLIIFLLMSMIGALAFFIESALGLSQLYMGLSAVLSGYLIPLELFPPTVRVIAQALPFRFTLSFPVELMLGRWDRPHALELLLAQWAYVLAEFLLLQLVWRAGMKRFGAFGG